MSLSYQRHRRKLLKRRTSPQRHAPAAPSTDPNRRYGFALERRAVFVFSLADAAVPHWWRGIRQSTLDEDHAGVDLWASTDRGDIAMQVKPSAARARLFAERHHHEEIAIVVLHQNMTDDEMQRAVVAAALRVWLLRLREGRRGPKSGERRAA